MPSPIRRQPPAAPPTRPPASPPRTSAPQLPARGWQPSPSRRPVVSDASLDLHAIRSWQANSQRIEQRPLRVPGSPDAITAPLAPYAPISESKLADRVLQAHEARRAELASGASRRAALVTPEDGNVTAKAYHLASFSDGGEQFAYAMARVGEVEGFKVVLRVAAETEDRIKQELSIAKLDNVSLLPVTDAPARGPGRLELWSEDHGELHLDGTVSVPRSLHTADGVGSRAYDELFRRRAGRVAPELDLQGRALSFPIVGAVSERNAQRALVALSDRPRVTNGYLEGGNSLVGRRADGTPFVLVGKDSLEASRLVLEKDLGRSLSEPELRRLVADDFGVDPAQVIGVEQPGEFHLDMRMMLLPGGQVVLNDAAAAAQLQREWALADHAANRPATPPPGSTGDAQLAYRAATAAWERDGATLNERLGEVQAQAEATAQYERLAAEQLAAAGLAVHRMAGVFEELPGKPPMNFLNGEAAKNPKGEGFYVALGGDRRAEQYVVDTLVNTLPSGLNRVHFLARNLTTTTLRHFGGLSCRVKLEGDPRLP